MRDWVSVPFQEAKLAPETNGNVLAPAAGPPRVFIALPTYNGYHKSQSLFGLMLASERAQICYELGNASLLDTNFNNLVCKGRNSRGECPWTHWGMHHADISAPPFWLDTMLGEMARVGADVLSAVVAIKDARRTTSTGTIEQNGSIRRLTLKEIHKLPETFSAADLPIIGIHTPLVVNTGLLLLRFTEPWADEFQFNIGSGILKKPNGKFSTVMMPEDWNFSHWCNLKGLRLFATRKVFVQHWDGGVAWDNGVHEDGWETDLGDDPDLYEEIIAARRAEGVLVS